MISKTGALSVGQEEYHILRISVPINSGGGLCQENKIKNNKPLLFVIEVSSNISPDFITLPNSAMYKSSTNY